MTQSLLTSKNSDTSPGNIGGIAGDEELLDPEPVGHIVVLPAPAPEQVAEPVHQPDQTEKMDILILFHGLP